MKTNKQSDNVFHSIRSVRQNRKLVEQLREADVISYYTFRRLVVSIDNSLSYLYELAEGMAPDTQ